MDEALHLQSTPAGDNTQAAEQGDYLVTVVDVQFRNGCKSYYFNPGNLDPKPGDGLIIDTARGIEYAVCQQGKHKVPNQSIVPPLRKVLRLATEQDRKVLEDNCRKEKEAMRICQEKVELRKLDMQLVSAEYSFDGSKVLLFFTADARVDFRELVKDLASALHTRIELRQIGVRDKAKMLGGLGICGRPFCCKQFLDDFEPVSIKMAKTQNLSLNPTKISGTCGRLMCCLKYEQDAYEGLIKTIPKEESFVDTPDGRGTVTDINLLRQQVRVRMEKAPDTFGTYKVDEIYVIRNGKPKHTDAPIPEDFAPISGGQPRRRRLEAEEPIPEVKLIPKAGEEEAPTPAESGHNRNHRRKKPAPKPDAKSEESASGAGVHKPGHSGNHHRRPFRHKGGHGGQI